MAYSAKKLRVIKGGMLALALPGLALVIWLRRNHADPDFVGLFRVALALIVIGLVMRSYSYMDEVQRQSAQKRWFWGTWIGFAAMAPVVVLLQTHGPWLDAAEQFIFHHSVAPWGYFSLGVGIPVMFQTVSALVLSLLSKLSRGARS